MVTHAKRSAKSPSPRQARRIVPMRAQVVAIMCLVCRVGAGQALDPPTGRPKGLGCPYRWRISSAPPCLRARQASFVDIIVINNAPPSSAASGQPAIGVINKYASITYTYCRTLRPPRFNRRCHCPFRPFHRCLPPPPLEKPIVPHRPVATFGAAVNGRAILSILRPLQNPCKSRETGFRVSGFSRKSHPEPRTLNPPLAQTGGFAGVSPVNPVQEVGVLRL